MLEAVAAQPLVERVFFNDPDLVDAGLCTDLSGHDDHVHVEIEPPAISEAGRVGGADAAGEKAATAARDEARAASEPTEAAQPPSDALEASR